MQYLDILSQSPVFKNTNPSRIEEIMEKITWQTRRYNKGEMVAQADDPCDFLMIVLSGSVKGEMTDASGKVIKIEDIPSPRPIALAFIFGQQNRFPVNVTANEETLMLLIPKPDLITLLQSDKQVLQNVLDGISSRGQFLSQKIKTLSMKSLRGRIAQLLLELQAEAGGTVVQLPSSQTDLADYFGVARPSLARTLGELSDEGIITVERRQVTIHDRRRLVAATVERGG